MISTERGNRTNREKKNAGPSLIPLAAEAFSNH